MPPTGRSRARGARRDLLWAVAGFALIQFGLSVAVERDLLEVRDPEFAAKLEHLRARVAEAPGRPLAVALGSSRTQMGLDAGRLSRTGPWLVFNLGFDGCSLMMDRVSLRRVLEADLRPDLVVVEVLPLQLLVNDDYPVEDRWMHGERLRADELAAVYPYSTAPHRLLTRWAGARACPYDQHHEALRAWLGLDRAADGGPAGPDTAQRADAWGWKPFPFMPPPEQIAAYTRLILNEYRREFRVNRIEPKKLRALRDLLADCRRERLPAVMLLTPESRAFQALYPDGLDHDLAVTLEGLRHEFGLPAVIDARTWIGDDGFVDSHHLHPPGARAFTDRFGREVLQPLSDSASREVAFRDRTP